MVESAASARSAQGDRRVVEAEPDARRRARRRATLTTGSSARQHEQRLGRQRGRPSPASARPPAPARRSGRAGRGTGCASSSARGRVRRAISGSANSSTSNRPSCAPARRRPAARSRRRTARLAPAPLRQSGVLGLEGRRGQRGAGRLAVGRGDEHDAVRQPRGEPLDGVGRQAQQRLAGQAGAAAASAPARQRPDHARSGRLGGEEAHAPRIVALQARRTTFSASPCNFSRLLYAD